MLRIVKELREMAFGQVPSLSRISLEAATRLEHVHEARLSYVRRGVGAGSFEQDIEKALGPLVSPTSERKIERVLELLERYSIHRYSIPYGAVEEAMGVSFRDRYEGGSPDKGMK